MVRRPPGPPPTGLHTGYPAQEYDTSRPLYPGALFDPLRPFLGPRLAAGPLRVLDLACGTGLAWHSFRSWGPELPVQLALVEPNGELLAAARAKAAPDSPAPPLTLVSAEARAEALPPAIVAQDLILVGSAWHWFQPAALAEIDRVLVPGGLLYVFEYQFPKLEDDRLGLNEWVRRQFNEHWKFADQAPRGTLGEKTEALRRHSQLALRRRGGWGEVSPHSAERFAEVIFTQARYLDYETRIGKQNSLDARNAILEEVRCRLPEAGLGYFRYGFESYLFQKRQV